MYLAPLYKDISPSSNEVSSIKARLKFSSHKLSLSSQFMPVFYRADWVILVIGEGVTTLAWRWQEKVFKLFATEWYFEIKEM